MTSDTKTLFDDTTQDPDIPTYYYKITARNEQGEGPGSNELALSLSSPENICLEPGITLLTDPANDIFTGIVPQQSNEPFYDARSLSISQPYFADGSYKIALHLRMTSLETLPVGATWPVSFCSPAFECTDPNAAISATNKYFTVRMTTANGPTPVFELLSPQASGTSRTTQVLAQPESNYQANGLITMVVNASALGLTPAGAGTQKLQKFLTRISAGAVTPDNMPDSLVGSGVFTTKPLSFCAPNTAPIARLTATPNSGQAPLLVSLSGAGSSDSDQDDTIVSYTFDFGDGSASVTQPGSSVSHSYQAAGNYNVELHVRDSRGLRSIASDVVRVTVLADNAAPTASLSATPTSGSSPLTVSFDASASSDPDQGDHIASYSIDFGDGVIAPAQSSSSFSHTYSAAGTFNARLTVKDSYGAASTNLAEQIITVAQGSNVITPFTFAERTNVPVNTFVSSEGVVMSGYSGTLPISVDNSLQYSINGGAYTNVAGEIASGARLNVRHVSAATEGTAKESQVTVGGYQAIFRSVTTTVDRVPDDFSFGSKSEQEPNTLVSSDIQTLTGYDEAVVVAGPGIQYRINGGTWTSARGTLVSGQTLQVQHTTSSSSLGYTKTYLKVGGVTGYFTTRTKK